MIGLSLAVLLGIIGFSVIITSRLGPEKQSIYLPDFEGRYLRERNKEQAWRNYFLGR